MRVLQQLAADEGQNYPKTVHVFQTALYVDDALFGADNISELIETRDQLIELMKRGGFQLRKWTLSAPEVFQDLPATHVEASRRDFETGETHKILGVCWLPHRDIFQFTISTENSPPLTKRA